MNEGRAAKEIHEGKIHGLKGKKSSRKLWLNLYPKKGKSLKKHKAEYEAGWKQV